MAVISKDTFAALKRYSSVRLQQGVPIADADWNEQDDIRKFELRSHIKWFVGEGVPAGRDGSFKIQGKGTDGDFLIGSGVTGTPDPSGLGEVGRCLVGGVEVLIDADIQFAKQPLHEAVDTKGDLAKAWGVPSILALKPAAAGVTVATVYLDVWARLVTPTEAPSLILPGLGTESCARLKREWAVRIRDGKTVVPQPKDPDYLDGHSYYALAFIARNSTDAVVNPGDVTDKRQIGRGLSALDGRLINVESRLAALENKFAWFHSESPKTYEDRIDIPLGGLKRVFASIATSTVYISIPPVIIPVAGGVVPETKSAVAVDIPYVDGVETPVAWDGSYFFGGAKTIDAVHISSWYGTASKITFRYRRNNPSHRIDCSYMASIIEV